MAGINDRRNKPFILERELMFALYIRLNTYDAVSMRLEAEGMVNPLNGKRFSRTAIRNAIFNSDGFLRWQQKRLDPTVPAEVTQEERDEAKKLVEELMPRQRALIEKFAIEHAVPEG